MVKLLVLGNDDHHEDAEEEGYSYWAMMTIMRMPRRRATRTGQ